MIAADQGSTPTDPEVSAENSVEHSASQKLTIAGGLAPLRTFFSSIPADTGMTFVVVVHLSPDHESILADLLRGHTLCP